ncbi:MAG TPA: N-acetylmuramoyl-L-alanine amidase family protein [Bacilli bacterium]
MKRILLILVILVMSPFVTALVSAENSVNVYINGSKWQGADSAILFHSAVFLPISVINNGLGIQTKWNGQDQNIVMRMGTDRMVQTIGKSTAAVDGKNVELAEAPRMFNNQPYVAARSLTGAFRVKTTWDGLKNALYLFKNDRGISTQTASKDENAAENESQAAEEKISRQTEADSEPDRSILSENRQNETDLTFDDVINTSGKTVVKAISSDQNGIVIRMDGAVTPDIFTLPDPYRIVVDLRNAELDRSLLSDSAAQNGEVAANHPYVENIRYALFDNAPVTVRVVIDLNRNVNYKLVQDEADHQIVISIPTKVYKVVVDAGHGGTDPGSTGYSKKDEKWFTLALAKKLAAILGNDSSIEPILTRSDDSTVSLDERVAIANKENADLFVSIHGNIYENSQSIRGTETYYARDESIPLAEELHKRVLSATGFPDRHVRKENYRVIKNTKMPAVLLEIGYLSNPTDEKNMLNESFQEKLAGEIASGIQSYLKQMGEEN